MQVYALDHEPVRTFANRVALARLDQTEATDIAEILLVTADEPGRLRALPERVASRAPLPLLPLLALADVTVPVAIIEPHHPTGGQPWAAVVATVTGASIVEPSAAHMVAVVDVTDPSVDECLRRLFGGAGGVGSHAVRHLFLPCRSIVVDHPAAPPKAVTFSIESRGRATRFVSIEGVRASLIESLFCASSDAGTRRDTWFVAAGGVVLGVPRAARVCVLPIGRC